MLVGDRAAYSGGGEYNWRINATSTLKGSRMTTVYEHLLWTGSGRNKATLSISDEEAELVYSSDWMGLGNHQWTLRFAHRQVSPRYGILILQSAEYHHNPKRKKDDTLQKRGEIVSKAHIPENPTELDDLNPLPVPYADFEYIILAGGEPWIADDPVLEDIASMGYAGWSQTFDLILFLHCTQQTSAEDDGGTHLDEVLQKLNQCKFSSVS